VNVRRDAFVKKRERFENKMKTEFKKIIIKKELAK
jgi:hypothetical protein